MIIGTSNVAMASETTRKASYTENRQRLMKNLATGEMSYSQNSFSYAYDYAAREENQMKENKTANKLSELNADRQKENLGNLVRQLREYMVNFRSKLQLMIGRRNYFGRYDGTINLTNQPATKGYNLWRRIEYTSYTYEEKEEMTFSTKGKAITGDGREIEFNMELFMSHEFVRECESLQKDVVAIMTDPLVINLTDSPVSISDQKWKFDIDSDGVEDNISMLEEGSGYLVLDKNQDGKINDGSELFGARTGNGFGELSAYDEDGNGWIDENDSVFRRLSVWIKDSKGTDKMVSLKDADVGAIYLGSAASEFAVKSSENNDYYAQVRRSGMYLTENGNARSIQQLDMVKALIS